MRSPLRIATVYKRDPFRRFAPAKMSTIRWLRISAGLAASGHRVDMIMNGSGIAHANPNLRSVPFAMGCNVVTSKNCCNWELCNDRLLVLNAKNR
jgi:hypothetical protein